ncbi:MAG: hypothetical protein WHT29_03000 [Bacteroidales bacterium]|nr:hypothetical protein [Bacteroidales bacterium]HOK97656.1 hypothetical protein [Bacteroidales bacterium]HPO64805.1 hypothetical protein [Bacteroidales bacterium]
MKTVVLSLLFTASLQAQPINFIGMSKQEIIKTMQKNNPGFDLDEGAKNTTFNYIKFVDKYNEETYLFFLDNNNVCTHTKLMSDYSNLKQRIDELNKYYKKAGENKWVFVDKNKVFFVELKKEEWFFTIVVKQKT